MAFTSFSKENHLNEIYQNITKKNIDLEDLISIFNLTSNSHYVAKSHLLDSYYILNERPDMAFTYLWKSFNCLYRSIAIRDSINSGNLSIQITDGKSITCFIDKLVSIQNDSIDGNFTIKSLFEEYIKILPIKNLKFLANYLLKGYAIEKSNLPKFLFGSSYQSFKKNHNDIYLTLEQTYLLPYKAITNTQIVNNSEVDLGILDKKKSKDIPESLASKFKTLLTDKSVNISYNGNNHTLSYVNDNEYYSFVLKGILYAIRNNSFHGNKSSRLNSSFVNQASYDNCIYNYFLLHFFVNIALIVEEGLNTSKSTISIENYAKLQSIL